MKSSIVLKKVSISKVFSLYTEIFGEALTKTIISKRKKKGDLVAFHILSFNEIIGFVILQYRNGECHIWLTGLLPKFRGKGLGTKLLTGIEQHAITNFHNRITMSTFNHRKEMIALAVKSGYKIVSTEEGQYGDKVKIRLVKTLRHKRELRILLTTKCNFKCFFCHSEGLDTEETYKNVSAEKIVDIIKQAVKIGYDDITFTGGEPLLKKDKLLKVLSRISSINPIPDITIVSNAVCLTEDIISKIVKYPGKLKMNISMHSFNKKQFEDITQKKNQYDKVCNNIKNAVKAGVKVKLNCVILAGINSSEYSLKEYIKNATSIGVLDIKFLELLVLPNNKNQHGLFISSNAIAHELTKTEAIFIDENDRVKHFSHKNYPNLGIEVTRLTCKVGCTKCMLVRDRTLGPDLNYYPCFIHSEKPIVISEPKNISEVFKNGEKFIAKYAKKYGDDSPILIKQDKFVKSRSQAFFYIDLSPDKIEKILNKHCFSTAKILSFKLYYVKPDIADDEWNIGKKSLKFGYDDHSPHKIDFIFSRHFKEIKNGFVCWKQKFINDIPPPACGSIKQAKKIIEALSFKCYMEFHFDITEYKNDNINISIDNTPNIKTLKVGSNLLDNEIVKKLLKDLNAKNIKIPHHLWLEKIKK